MTVQPCPKKYYQTVEVCGGVCECAGPRCKDCKYYAVGTEAHDQFMAAMNKEYPLEGWQ